VRFSILIPVYNVDKYLHRCLQSVLAQTYKDFEVILVDDGSTDNSAKICDYYRESCPSIFKVIHKENQGLVSARRIGLANARGDFACFLDSDDYWESNLLEQVSITIEQYNPDIIVFGNMLVGPDGSIISYRYPEFEKVLYEKEDLFTLKRLLVEGTKLNQLCKKVVRLSIIDREKDYSSFYHVSSGEDQLQTLPMLDRASRLAILNQCLYNYCINDGSITQSRVTLKHIESLVSVYRELGLYSSRWGIDPTVYQQRFANILIILLKSMIIFRFGPKAYTKEERENILKRCEQVDFRSYLVLYKPIDIELPYRLLINAMQAEQRWLVRLNLFCIATAYYGKKRLVTIYKFIRSKQICEPRT